MEGACLWAHLSNGSKRKVCKVLHLTKKSCMDNSLGEICFGYLTIQYNLFTFSFPLLFFMLISLNCLIVLYSDVSSLSRNHVNIIYQLIREFIFLNTDQTPAPWSWASLRGHGFVLHLLHLARTDFRLQMSLDFIAAPCRTRLQEVFPHISLSCLLGLTTCGWPISNVDR